MNSCARIAETTGQRCGQRTSSGDCGRHGRNQAVLAAASTAASPLSVADPFAAVSAWTGSRAEAEHAAAVHQSVQLDEADIAAARRAAEADVQAADPTTVLYAEQQRAEVTAAIAERRRRAEAVLLANPDAKGDDGVGDAYGRLESFLLGPRPDGPEGVADPDTITGDSDEARRQRDSLWMERHQRLVATINWDALNNPPASVFTPVSHIDGAGVHAVGCTQISANAKPVEGTLLDHSDYMSRCHCIPRHAAWIGGEVRNQAKVMDRYIERIERLGNPAEPPTIDDVRWAAAAHDEWSLYVVEKRARQHMTVDDANFMIGVIDHLDRIAATNESDESDGSDAAIAAAMLQRIVSTLDIDPDLLGADIAGEDIHSRLPWRRRKAKQTAARVGQLMAEAADAPLLDPRPIRSTVRPPNIRDFAHSGKPGLYLIAAAADPAGLARIRGTDISRS